MPLIRAELPSLCRLTRRWQSDKPCRDGAPRGEVKEGESAQEYSAGAALEHGQGSGGQWSMDQSLQQNQAWPTAWRPEPTLGSTSQRRSRSLAVVRTHSRRSGPGAACFTGARLMPVWRLSQQTTIKCLCFQTDVWYHWSGLQQGDH